MLVLILSVSIFICPCSAVPINVGDAIQDLFSRLDALQSQVDQMLPAGLVAFFPNTTCPVGWREYTALQGRYVVGSTGANQGITVGTALDNGENRTSGTHSHDADPPDQIANFNTDSGGGHSHSVNPPRTSTSTNGAHTHSYTDYSRGGGQDKVETANDNIGDRTKNTGEAGSHSHTVNIPAFNSGTAGAHTHTGSFPINIPSFTTGTGTYRTSYGVSMCCPSETGVGALTLILPLTLIPYTHMYPHPHYCVFYKQRSSQLLLWGERSPDDLPQ